MEVPRLGISSIWCLDNKVSSEDIEVSSGFHVGNNVEWSLNIESVLFVEFTLLWFSLPLVSIDNIPLLVESTVFLPHVNVLSFFISVS
jgi:hypothetical protein